jgi:molecular chaperone DnaK (HSP70)
MQTSVEAVSSVPVEAVSSVPVEAVSSVPVKVALCRTCQKEFIVTPQCRPCQKIANTALFHKKQAEITSKHNNEYERRMAELNERNRKYDEECERNRIKMIESQKKAEECLAKLDEIIDDEEKHNESMKNSLNEIHKVFQEIWRKFYGVWSYDDFTEFQNMWNNFERLIQNDEFDEASEEISSLLKFAKDHECLNDLYVLNNTLLRNEKI